MLVVADTTSVNQKDIQLVLANNRTITFEEDADIKYDKRVVLLQILESNK